MAKPKRRPRDDGREPRDSNEPRDNNAQTIKKSTGTSAYIAACAVACIAILAGVAARGRSGSSTAEDSTFGACRRLQELDALPETQPSCPFVVRGYVADAGWLEKSAWRRVERAPRQDRPIRYDVLPAGRTFRYWDNNSVLAAEALARPVATDDDAHRPPRRRSGGRSRVARRRRGGALRRRLGAAARYGGDAAAISVHLAADIDRAAWKHAAFLWLQEPGGTPRAPGLWAGGPSSASFPHFDLFSNLYTVLAGSKEVVLAPPSTAAAGFRVHPATHPRARQARVDGFASGAVPATLRATLRAGDAVFILRLDPPLHRPAPTPAPAVATTANPPEFKYFDAWVGLPPRRSRPVPPCPEAGADDAALAADAAVAAAAEFRRAFRPELLRLYLPLFVGNLLTKISRQRAMANLFADVLDFVDACLLEDENASDANGDGGS
ncbi:sulfuric ester hydrolase [Aureococcus anophagefferens]|nr:sulfuric ester hydrolase [Aureococcus anophagefferens]